MALDPHHFPTFDKLRRVLGPVWEWLRRHALNQRSILRSWLCFLLILSGSYFVTDRYLSWTYGLAAGPMIQQAGFPPQFGRAVAVEESWPGMIHAVGRNLLGSSGCDQALVIVTLCLVGLSVGSRGFEGESRGRWWSHGRPLPRATVTAGSLDPPSPPPQPPPPRHPLDPDPDDLPLEPLWPRRSRPSK